FRGRHHLGILRAGMAATRCRKLGGLLRARRCYDLASGLERIEIGVAYRASIWPGRRPCPTDADGYSWSGLLDGRRDHRRAAGQGRSAAPGTRIEPRRGRTMNAEYGKRITTVLDKYVTQGQISGAVALVHHREELLYHEARGLRDLATS